MELLWPEMDPESAANNLNKSIHAARRALEPDLKSGADSHFIITQGQQVLLRAPGNFWIDVGQFEQRAAEAIKTADTQLYENALLLYEGDLLIEDLYEDWAAARREQLRALHQDLLMRLAQLCERQSQYQQSIKRLKELLACEPSNEEAHRQLMRLYALTGNRHQALRQYEQCREAIRKELDAEPDPATVKLHQQIISGQIQLISAREVERDSDRGKVIDSLAVLPLVNASADPNAEYLSDGITESIINTLSQLRQLRVMARSTVFRYKGREIDPQTVGRELGVRAVMTGHVLQLGDSLVVRAELVDTADGSQLWGEQYRRELVDIFELQEEISKEVSEKLRLRLAVEEKRLLAKRYTENTQAYHLYLKGVYYRHKWTDEGYQKAIDYFNQAIAVDPNYALAYAGLADTYGALGFAEALAIAPQKAWLLAKAAAEKAVNIDNTLAEAHASLALVRLNYEWNWLEVERGLERALALNPYHVGAYHWYSHYLIVMGRMEESLAASLRATELDPLNLGMTVHLGFHYYCARQYDQAIEQCSKTIELDPGFHEAHQFLGWAYEQKKMYEEAIAEIQKAISLSGGRPYWVAALGHVYAVSGQKEEAQKILDELKELSKRRYVSPFDIALTYTGLGEMDQAFIWLQEAYEQRSGWFPYIKVYPIFDALRSDPRFADLLRRVGLEQ